MTPNNDNIMPTPAERAAVYAEDDIVLHWPNVKRWLIACAAILLLGTCSYKVGGAVTKVPPINIVAQRADESRELKASRPMDDSTPEQLLAGVHQRVRGGFSDYQNFVRREK